MRISGIVIRLSVVVATIVVAGCYARDGEREDADSGAPLLDKSNDDGQTSEPFAYFEDFHDDPGWSVSDPEKYYWDPTCECFFLTMEGGEVTHGYAYVDLAAMGFEFGPIRLTYEIKIRDLTWGANAGLMFLTESLDRDRAIIQAIYGFADPGHAVGISVFPYFYAEYLGDDAWEAGVWMSNEILWDGVDVTFTERRSSVVTRILKIENSEVWTEDPVPYLGYSIVGYDLYADSAAHAWIDNIRLETLQ
ncbi:MAG: hypothetical protein IT350_05710 [Deltaproteobacteria bacterium]|nr:hypothetical protein [Deltaproteobacteria bacterium]